MEPTRKLEPKEFPAIEGPGHDAVLRLVGTRLDVPDYQYTSDAGCVQVVVKRLTTTALERGSRLPSRSSCQAPAGCSTWSRDALAKPACSAFFPHTRSPQCNTQQPIPDDCQSYHHVCHAAEMAPAASVEEHAKDPGLLPCCVFCCLGLGLAPAL